MAGTDDGSSRSDGCREPVKKWNETSPAAVIEHPTAHTAAGAEQGLRLLTFAMEEGGRRRKPQPAGQERGVIAIYIALASRNDLDFREGWNGFRV